MAVRVVVADDQALVRMGLGVLIEAEEDLELVGEAADGARAVEVVRAVVPDVVLMDVRMPVMDGLAALREISADEGLAGVRVVVLTTFELDEYVFEALRAGASGFVVKDADPGVLLEAVRVAARGEALLSPSVTKRLIQDFSAARAAKAMEENPPSGLDELTAREMEVFKLIARGMSNSEIAGELVVSETTVKTHVARILMKLGLRDRVQAVVLAYESGLVQPGAA